MRRTSRFEVVGYLKGGRRVSRPRLVNQPLLHAAHSGLLSPGTCFNPCRPLVSTSIDTTPSCLVGRNLNVAWHQEHSCLLPQVISQRGYYTTNASDNKQPVPDTNTAKPLEQWSADEVQQWFKTGEYLEYANQFAKLKGKQLAGLQKEDFRAILDNVAVGSALYNDLQTLKKPIAKASSYRLLLGEGNLGSGEGLDPTNPVFSPRVATCDTLIDQLMVYKAGLIRAPPYSGKTSLAILLESRLLKKNFAVHLCTMLPWDSTRTPVEEHLQNTMHLPPIASWTSLTDTVIIIDEAQTLYPLGSDHLFWKMIKTIQQARNCTCYVLLIAAYGERVTASASAQASPTPITFDLSLGLETVRLTQQEFTEFLDAYSAKSIKGKLIPLSDATRERIFWMTNGHAGLVRATLRALEDAFWPAARAGTALTDADVMRPLVMGTFTSRIRNTRAVPVIELGEKEKAVLKEVLIEGSCAVPKQPFPSEYAKLIHSGVLAENGEDRLVFVAPIVRSIFLQHLYRSPLILNLTADFDEFVRNSISRLNPSVLKNSLSRARDRPPVERQWQVEYYRAATTALPENYISPDVGAFFDKSGDVRKAGKLDFYVNSDLGWAIELLRDGDKASEHEARFAKDGLYKDIPIAKHALLDFRMTEPKGELRDHFWYIIVQSDFQGAILRRKGQEDEKVLFLVVPKNKKQWPP